MPAIAPITLANGESTPVNHVFAPLGPDAKTGIFWYEDQSPRVTATSSLGFPRVGIRTKREQEVAAGQSAKNTVAKVEVTLALPQLESLSAASSGFTPAPTVAYVDRWKCEYILSSRDTIDDRLDARAYSANLLDHDVIKELVHNLKSLYS